MGVVLENFPPPSAKKLAFVLVMHVLLLFGALVPERAAAADPVALDEASTAGIAYPGGAASKSQGESVVFDYDGDGDLDILLSAHNGGGWPLLRNEGGRFTQVQSGVFWQYDRHGCVAGDFGRRAGDGTPDGLPDLYCVVGGCHGTCGKAFPNELFLQKPDRVFSRVSGARGAGNAYGRGRDVVALDYDRDGLMDLLVADNATPGVPSSIHLFRNAGGSFVEVADPVLQSAPSASCVAAADLDGDGWRDFALCSGKSVVGFRNVGGAFTPWAGVGLSTTTEVHDVEFADVSGDGRPDLLVSQVTRLTVRLNVDGAFPRDSFTMKLGSGRDLAVGDVNLDGAPDIYVVQGGNARLDDLMLLNNGGGTSYRSLPIPQVRTGDGDVATTVPNWRDGLPAFLVTNGKYLSAGPVQLITFAAAPPS